MSSPHRLPFLKSASATRILVLGLTFTSVALVNIMGILAGITIVLSHLYYLPIALAGYWYPRRGVTISVCIAAFYSVSSLLFSTPDIAGAASILSRAAMLILIGGVISYLSLQLAAKEELYEGLFVHSGAGTLLIQERPPPAVVLRGNRRAAGILGVTTADLQFRPLQNFWDDLPAIEEFIQGTTHQGAVVDREISLRGAEGRRICALVSGAPLSEDRLIMTITDITEQKMIRGALEEATRKMATLSHLIHHELADRVATLAGYLEIGRMRFEDRDILGFIRKIEGVTLAVREQLDLARDFQDLGTSPPVWQNFERAVIQGSSGIEFSDTRLRSWISRLEILADPHLPIIISTLITHCMRADPVPMRILCTYVISGDRCTVVLEDDGPGIAPGERERMFADTKGPAGIGLFLAREVLGITGISIAEEGADGSGTRFVLQVPPDAFRVV